tara:strand:+ start:3201 stop:4166 length:966 start_codon:yes stop_codon:yes gene_type:complete
MPKIELPRLPVRGKSLLKEKKFSDVKEPYTVSTYARIDIGGKDSGLMSTANGRLSSENLMEAIQIRDYHVQPEQASLARSESMLSTSTIYGNGIPNQRDAANYFTLPGCSLRWYQPYATSVSLMQWSFFVSYNSWRGIYKDLDGEIHSRGVSTPIYLRCRLDNDVVDGSTRILGQNMFHPISPGARDLDKQTGPGIDVMGQLIENFEAEGHSMRDFFRDFGLSPPAPYINNPEIDYRGGNPQYCQTEAHSASQFDLHHMTALSKGYHEISVECSIQQPEGAGVYLQNVGRTGKAHITGRGYFNLVGKLSLGVRNARVLNLL